MIDGIEPAAGSEVIFMKLVVMHCANERRHKTVKFRRKLIVQKKQFDEGDDGDR